MPFKAKQFNRIFPLDRYFEEMIGDKKEVWIADLGAGMFSTTGSTWPDVVVHMYPSDYLANEFNEMLQEKNIVPVIPLEYQDMEHLTYPDEFFDIVNCINALDHCEHPDLALKEMYRVCKPGGWIYLKHQKNNGDYQKFKGMHHWNIWQKDGECYIWNKDRKFAHTLSHIVPGFTTSVEKGELEYIVSRLHK